MIYIMREVEQLLHTNLVLLLNNILSPCTILLVNKIQGQAFNRPLRVLLDSGLDCSHIQKRVLPPGVEATSVNKATIGITGSATVAEELELQDMVLPEFSHTLRVNDTFRCYVMNNASVYDVILGRDFLMAVGIDVLHSAQEVKLMDIRLPFRRRDSLEDPFDLNTTCLETLAADVDDREPFSIMDAQYEAVNPRQVAEAQTHLSPSQRKELGDLLCKFPRLFDGTLRSYQGPKVHLELKEGAQDVHQRAYLVPDANLEAFKKELDHLCENRCARTLRSIGLGIANIYYPQERWMSSIGYLMSVLSTRSSSVKCILFPAFMNYYASGRDINILRSSIFRCSITPSISMTNPRTIV